MRLVSWNCKGAFARKHQAVSELRPDVLVVPECEQLAAVPQTLGAAAVNSFQWVGENPNKGLAVLSYGDYALQIHPGYNPRHRWILPLRVTGPASFLLLAVWTVPHPDSRSYVHPLFEAFAEYQPLAAESEVLWAGDFNASFRLDRPSRRYLFRDFVAVLEKHQLRSLYHARHGCAHGAEPDPTFYLYHHAARGFHLDYAFASPGLQRRSHQVSLGTHADWAKRSDHMPLVCDFSPAEPPSER